jgi:cell division protein FtsB
MIGESLLRRGLPPLRVALRHHVPLLAMLLVAGAIVIGVAVLPMRTYLEQRELLQETDEERQQILGQVDQLESQLEVLQTDSEVERLARENFDLVKPGEESYRILPPAGG